MTWNHRVIRNREDNGEYYFAFHECFYNQPSDSVPCSWTENPIHVGAESVDGLKRVLERMSAALAKPVLRIDGNKLVEVND